MSFVNELSVSSAHYNTYPDTHRVDPDHTATLDSSGPLYGTLLGTPASDNFSGENSSQTGNPPAFVWMTPVDQQLTNDL